MGANLTFACPIEGCDYTAGVRLGMGAEEDPAEHSKWVETLRTEHPNHNKSAGPRNVKPKTLLTEQMSAEDGELNF
ncbi:hypothetical protein QE394_001089 [Arthrobacter sp. SORGH_AS 212]|uniref:hypothetical protein n=1 Tax=Pseudarthrobacter sp. SORGH_AS 212 TaxID=3041777 RepID=UPI00277FB716|nr:hypothetical protein [Arthrobacter sp. SORGH_AS_0212]